MISSHYFQGKIKHLKMIDFIKKIGPRAFIPFTKINQKRIMITEIDPDKKWALTQDTNNLSKKFCFFRDIASFPILLLLMPTFHYILNPITFNILKLLTSLPNSDNGAVMDIAVSINFIVMIIAFTAPLMKSAAMQDIVNKRPLASSTDLLWRAWDGYKFSGDKPLMNRLFSCNMFKASEHLIENGMTEKDISVIYGLRHETKDPEGKHARTVLRAIEILEHHTEENQKAISSCLNEHERLLDTLTVMGMGNFRQPKQPDSVHVDAAHQLRQ